MQRLSYIDIDVEEGVYTTEIREGLDPSFFVCVELDSSDTPILTNRVIPYAQQLDYKTTEITLGVDAIDGHWTTGRYRLWRTTPYDAMLYKFEAGSLFSLVHLQRNWLQLLHLYQEIIEGKLEPRD